MTQTEQELNRLSRAVRREKLDLLEAEVTETFVIALLVAILVLLFL